MNEPTKAMVSLKDRLPNQHKKLLSVYITFLIFLAAEIVMDPLILKSYSRMWPLSLQFAPLMLCAMSQGCIMLVGGINLSLGASLSLATTIAAVTMFEGAGGMAGGVIATLAAGMGIGLVMGLVVTFGRLPDIIVTLAFSYIWNGAALLVLSKPGGHIPSAYAKFLQGQGAVPFAIIMILLMLILWKVMKNTRLGINIYAIGGNAKASFESGINVQLTKIMAYIISGLFMAGAALVLVGQTGCGDPTIGNAYGTKSIAAAILGGFSFSGGIGQMKGAVLGAFIYIAIENVLFFSGLSSFYQYIIQGTILIAAIGLKVISYYRKGGEGA